MNNSLFVGVSSLDDDGDKVSRKCISEYFDNSVQERFASFDCGLSQEVRFTKKTARFFREEVSDTHLNSTFVDLLAVNTEVVDDFKNARDLLYHWEGRHDGRIASVYAVFFVERNYTSRNLEAINLLLLSISAKRLTEWSMVSLLRASFSAKHYLPAWGGFYEQVKKELENNPRVRKLLAGLDD